MSWQAIDFQHIIVLDQSLVEQLDLYLQEKEADLGNVLMASLPVGREGITPPVLEPSKLLRLKLADALDGFSKRIRGAIQREEEIVSSKVLDGMVLEINEAFLNHIEVLEGCVRELFLQIDQIGLERWSADLLLSLDHFRDLLFQHVEDSYFAFNRVEELLKEFRTAIRHKEGKFIRLKTAFDGFNPVLDSSLKRDFLRLEKILKANHKKFSGYLIDYLQLEDRVNLSLKKIERYEVLERLDETYREKFKKVYFYTKLGALNAKPKPSFFQELMRALSHTVNVDYALDIFKDYIKALYTAHYHQSRVLKKENVRYLTEPGGLEKIGDVMKGYHSEILSLGSTIARYRELLLKTDPNPYIRSKWGFTEGIVAPEPAQAKELLELEFEIENLKKLNDHLNGSIQSAKKNQKPPEKIPFDKTIHKMLHEMGQPLTPYGMAKSRAEKILKHLGEVDEIGSTNPYSLDYTGDILSKMLRADWKYHVVQEIPEYNEIIKHHLGILGSVDDRRHLNRMNKFTYVTKEIARWVEKRETRKHEREIEFDIHDLKIYLQDFLALVQRTAQDDDKQAMRQKSLEFSYLLLIYRNLFGEFFHHLEAASSEGKRLRHQLLFVDQYFESIDQKLYEIKTQLENN